MCIYATYCRAPRTERLVDERQLRRPQPALDVDGDGPAETDRCLLAMGSRRAERPFDDALHDSVQTSEVSLARRDLHRQTYLHLWDGMTNTPASVADILSALNGHCDDNKHHSLYMFLQSTDGVVDSKFKHWLYFLDLRSTWLWMKHAGAWIDRPQCVYAM